MPFHAASIKPRVTVVTLRRRAKPTPDRDGFVTVMILMVIVLMLMLVLTYLRTMRVYNLKHESYGGNVNLVATQLVSDIATRIGSDGKIGPADDADDQGVYEPYDYPWTCDRSHAPCALYYPDAITSQQGLGDPQMDDSWLAPTEQQGGKWAQVSNITGGFLQYTDAGLTSVGRNAVTGMKVPADAPAGRAIPGVAGGQRVDFQNLDAADPRLVDTDGDGVGDALWFYPKRSLQGNLRYVAAVRVIDACGLLNLNTALGELWKDPSVPFGIAPKGEGPYEINAKTLLGSAIATASLDFRKKGVVLPANRVPAGWTAWDYWCASGAQIKDNGTSGVANRYGTADEFQLRDLIRNNASAVPAPALFSHYPALQGDKTLRRRVTTFSGVTENYPALPSAPFRDDNESSWNYARRKFDIYGNQGNLNLPPPPSPYPPLSGAQSSAFTYGGWWPQVDFWDKNTYGVTCFLQGINSGNPKAAYPYPAGFNFLTRYTTAVPRALQYQTQMGLHSFQDALGRDNAPTIASSQWSGWEPLPIMTEFYAEMPYVMNQKYQSVWNWTGTTLPTAAQAVLIFPGQKVSQLTQADIRNLNFGLGLSTNPPEPSVIAQTLYQYTQTATDITVQVQAYDAGASKTRCFKLVFKDSTAGVTVNALYAKYQAGDKEGTDFDGVGTNAATAALTLGLPVHDDCTPATNWNVHYINETINRLGKGGVGTSSGEVMTTGNSLTSTSWLDVGSAGVGSYALEVVNPYQIPIRLTNVHFQFKRFDYRIQSKLPGVPTQNEFEIQSAPANKPRFNSADLDTYLNAYFTAGKPVVDGSGTPMARDVEGYLVLKPGEKIVFYRNGTENPGPGGARGRPFGGPAYKNGVVPALGSPADVDISPLIASGAGVYKVDLTPFNATINPAPAPFDVDAPDLNGYSSAWSIQQVELNAKAQNASGARTTSWNSWMPYQRIMFPSLHAGKAATADCARFEANVPDGRQGAPGQLVYKQVDVRTFGADAKLDLLQARPPVYAMSQHKMPIDLGDYEIRTNTYGQVGSGLLDGSAGKLPFPDGGQTTSATAALGYLNPVTTMPLAASYLAYDAVNSGNTHLSALGRDPKVVFPGAATTYPGPNNTRVAYGSRQSIRNENWLWNYAGISGDAKYPGTFPELAAAANPQCTIRDNPTASGNGPERRDGFPHVLDLLKVPLVGPIYLINYRSDWWGGNWDYRGTPTDTEAQSNTLSPNSPLVGNWYANTLGDALNFHLAKDMEVNGTGSGLRGLGLRTDKPWFDWANAAANYPALPYDSAASYAIGQEAFYGNDIYVAQQTGALPAPDPTPGTGNVGVGLPWDYSNGPYARAGQFWQASWGEIFCAHLQVDSMAYKGDAGQSASNFKPGMVNLNTAPQAVLEALSLPPGVDKSAFALSVIANRQAPAYGAAVPGGSRKGLVLASEALGANGLKSHLGDGPSKFYTTDATLNLETLSWLPQQATCRSDAFIAYIVIYGFPATDFSLGPVEARRMIVLYSRDNSGAAATAIPYTVPNQ